MTHQCEPEPGEPSEEARAALEELESGPAFEDRPPAPRTAATPVLGAEQHPRGAAMLGLREVLEGPQKERIVIQAEVPGEPPDIDRLGLKAELDDGSLAVGPPLDELKDRAAATRRSSRLRRRSGRRS